MATRLRKPRKEHPPLAGSSEPSSSFVNQATKVDAVHPHEFLLAVVGHRFIEINGQRYEPTSAQRLKAAEHLAAALAGPDTEADDSYPTEEEKG